MWMPSTPPLSRPATTRSLAEVGLNVTVRYFAAAAEAAGRHEETIGFAPGATLGDLKRHLQERHGEQMARVLRSGSFLVDKVVRRDTDHPLSERVDVLPPFAGG